MKKGKVKKMSGVKANINKNYKPSFAQSW